MAGYLLTPKRPGEKAGDTPKIAGSKSGLAVVCGSGRTLWEDLAKLGEHGGAVMAVNLAGCFLKRIPEHWACVYPDLFQAMLPLRPGAVWQSDGRLQCGQGIETHSTHACVGVKHVWKMPRNGSGGLFGVRVALALGYAPVITSGITLDNAGRFYDEPGNHPPEDYTGFRAEWVGAAKHEFRGRVQAMSGFLRDLLGGP